MNWNAIPGIACSICFMLPVLVIAANKYYSYRSLNALMLYYTVMAITTAIEEGFIGSSEYQNSAYLISSYLNVPLMLVSLVFFCPVRIKQRSVYMLALGFIGYELITTAILGFSMQSIARITGVGLLIVLGYTVFLFVKQVQFSIMHSKAQGRIVMLAAVLFAYSCYLLLYYFSYVLKTPYQEDTRLLYFSSSIISSVIMSVGLHLLRRRMRELRDLRVTRRELEEFFESAGS